MYLEHLRAKIVGGAWWCGVAKLANVSNRWLQVLTLQWAR